MPESRYHWHPLPSELLRSLDNGCMLELEVGGKRFCITRHEDRFYAVYHACPHASGRLSEGRITQKGEVVCPRQGYRFRLDNGFNSSGEGYRLPTYPMRCNEDGWELGGPLETNSL